MPEAYVVAGAFLGAEDLFMVQELMATDLTSALAHVANHEQWLWHNRCAPASMLHALLYIQLCLQSQTAIEARQRAQVSSTRRLCFVPGDATTS